MFKVNIYIETDGNDKITRYRTYKAIVEFKTQNSGEQTREVHGTEKASGDGIVLTALTSALALLIKPCEVNVIISDKCDYVTETIRNGRMYTWLSNGWQTVQGKPVKNREEWKKIIRFTERHNITFIIKDTHPYKNRMQYDIKRLKGQNWQQQRIWR